MALMVKTSEIDPKEIKKINKIKQKKKKNRLAFQSCLLPKNATKIRRNWTDEGEQIAKSPQQC